MFGGFLLFNNAEWIDPNWFIVSFSFFSQLTEGCREEKRNIAALFNYSFWTATSLQAQTNFCSHFCERFLGKWATVSKRQYIFFANFNVVASLLQSCILVVQAVKIWTYLVLFYKKVQVERIIVVTCLRKIKTDVTSCCLYNLWTTLCLIVSYSLPVH